LETGTALALAAAMNASMSLAVRPIDLEPPGIRIAPLQRSDIPSVVDLLADVWPDDIDTPESLTWTIDHARPEQQIRRWVAYRDDRLVAVASAGLASWAGDRLCQLNCVVDGEERGHGIGRAMFGRAEEHAADLVAPVRTWTSHADPQSAAFVARRGFTHTRRLRTWVVDPRRMPTGELGNRIEQAAREGYRLVALRELLGRPRAIFGLFRNVISEVPEDTAFDVSWEDWEAQELHAPLFCADASFCIVDEDGSPVALTWIYADLTRSRARHGLTGTLATERHRGLAHLLKLASARWLAEHGVTALYTDNDSTNADMIALNEHLGFEPLLVFDLWLRRNPEPKRS
jgi:GNAT superfamily N-acetyltransferase